MDGEGGRDGEVDDSWEEGEPHVPKLTNGWSVSSSQHHSGPAGFPHQPGLPICQGSLRDLLPLLRREVPAGLGLCDSDPQRSPLQPSAHDEMAPKDHGPGKGHCLLQRLRENRPYARNEHMKIPQKSRTSPRYMRSPHSHVHPHCHHLFLAV